MTNIHIIFYSMYGHVYSLAEAIAKGIRQVPNMETSLYQVEELIPDDKLEAGAIQKSDSFV